MEQKGEKNSENLPKVESAGRGCREYNGETDPAGVTQGKGVQGTGEENGGREGERTQLDGLHIPHERSARRKFAGVAGGVT